MFTITAVVPTCERPVLLKRALQSIVAQELSPTEIIVVDDVGRGHEDATRRDLQRWGFGQVRVVANSHAKGVSGARNTGAELAAGELLAFLDDDDEWLPEYLSAALDQFEAKNLGILCADLLCQFEDGVDRPAKTAPDSLLPGFFLTRNPGFVGSNIIIRRSLYREVAGFDESIQAAEDMDFGLRVSLRGNVRYERLPKRLVRSHQHKEPRLCTPAGDAMCQGISRFYELHAHRMTEEQRKEFRSNARRFWGIDEHGKNLNLTAKAYAESFLPVLKTWLDQRRVGLDK
jgi:glycosyltransferase involved in cell wall biosynthesis